MGWLASEMNAPLKLPTLLTVDDDPDLAGTEVRRLLGISSEQQLEWTSASRAFDAWRDALEALGVAVFLFPMGTAACNGFSIWRERVPVVAVNTAWREEARIFTLFHELGHLLTRTSSACASSVGGGRSDPIERCCERVAAAVLLPDGDVRQALPPRLRQGPIDDLRVASSVASRFKVSLRAATIRLIHMGLANWELYEQIPAVSDAKPKGGGGGGRNRQAIREDEVGGRGVRLFVEGVRHDLLSRSQAVSYLDIPDPAFDQLAPR
jgi:Zn-dependent peptidase ImmA (M78 family)